MSMKRTLALIVILGVVFFIDSFVLASESVKAAILTISDQK